MMKILFGFFKEEKTHEEKETPMSVIANRLTRLGFDVIRGANGNFIVNGDYINYNQEYSKLFVRFLDNGMAALEDELGFTIGKFPRILEHHQICYAVEKTFAIKS